jgi:hypothetical protein
VEIGSGTTVLVTAAKFQIGTNPNHTLSTLEEEIVVESISTFVLLIESPDCDQYPFVGHVYTVLGLIGGGNDFESEECGETYSDVSTRNTRVCQEKSD